MLRQIRTFPDPMRPKAPAMAPGRTGCCWKRQRLPCLEREARRKLRCMRRFRAQACFCLHPSGGEIRAVLAGCIPEWRDA
jgi:hypothetical protein